MLQAEDRTALTQLGVIVGTVDFIAPEQSRNSSTVDIRADLYSLGCTFCYLLTGLPPFPGGTPTEKLLKHNLEPPPPLPQLPPAVVAVVHRLMAKKPQDRYQTPAELAAVLESLLAAPEQLTGARPDALLPTVLTIELPPVAEVPAPVPVPSPEPALVGATAVGRLSRRFAKAGPRARPTPVEGETPVCPSRILARARQEETSAGKMPAPRWSFKVRMIAGILLVGALVGAILYGIRALGL
jgi:serine/threonine protein kinase